jgi:hypothetical protein
LPFVESRSVLDDTNNFYDKEPSQAYCGPDKGEIMFILKAYGVVIGICGLMYLISRFLDFRDARARRRAGVLQPFSELKR